MNRNRSDWDNITAGSCTIFFCVQICTLTHYYFIGDVEKLSVIIVQVNAAVSQQGRFKSEAVSMKNKVLSKVFLEKFMFSPNCQDWNNWFPQKIIDLILLIIYLKILQGCILYIWIAPPPWFLMIHRGEKSNFFILFDTLNTKLHWFSSKNHLLSPIQRIKP